MKTRALYSMLCLMVLMMAANASAATYYVSTTGKDTNVGSLAAPWKTIQNGVNRMASGDTLLIRGGTYSELVQIKKPKVTIKNYSSETVVIDGRESIPTAIWGALITIGATDVTVEGLQLYRSKSRGVVIQPGAHRAKCSKLKVSYCWRHGFLLAATASSPANDVILDNSEIFRNERRRYYYLNPSKRPDASWDYGSPWGANVGVLGGVRTIIRNCKIYESYFEGLDLITDTRNSLVENNQIWGNTVSQVYLSSSAYNTLRSNVIYGTKSWDGTNSALGTAAIWLGGETWAASQNRDHGHRIYGNFVANSKKCLWIAGQTNAMTRNSYIFNNVIVEALPLDGSTGVNVQVQIGSGGTGNVFKNNAVLQTKPAIDAIGNPNRVTFSNNLWSQKPSVNATGNGDLVSGFSLAKDLESGFVSGGSLNKTHFALGSTSLSKDRGSWLTTVNMPKGATNATSIVVANGGFFHGDEKLKFANGKVATIKSVSGNTLTVSPAVTVPNGTGVSLYNYTGSKPNIGAWVFTTAS